MWISRKEYDLLKSSKLSSEVKPCPFCGGTARVFTSFGTSVECTKCGARVYSLYDKLAIAAWNKRVSETSEDS